MITDLVAVAVGGALGAVFRDGVVNIVALLFGRQFPWGTLTVNALGSLLMGLLFIYITERMHLTTAWRNFALVGFLGSFTTFSAFSMETLVLLQQDRAGLALMNVMLSVGVCLIAVWCGTQLGHRIS